MALPLFEPYQEALSIVQSDAVEWLLSVDPGSLDCVITDPAYESLEKHRAVGTTARLRAWFPVFPNERFPDFFAAAYRAMARNSHLYLMCDQATMFAVKPIGEQIGFTFWKALIWDKGRIGMGYHYRARHELILFFEKGKRRLADLGVPDVLNFPPDTTTDYPTAKPPDLLRLLVRQSSRPGELVGDPFVGSGTTAEAARSTGRRFAGCDVQKAAVDLALRRAAAAKEVS